MIVLFVENLRSKHETPHPLINNGGQEMKAFSKEELIAFEARVAKLFEEGKINTPIHLSGGNEDELNSIFEYVDKDDWVVSTHRNHYHYLLKGGSEKKLLDEILGKEEGCCHGKGRSMHIYDRTINFISSAIVGGSAAIAVGLALSLKKKFKGKRRPIVWCFCGDGAEDTGHFVEAVRFGAARALPLTFVVEDNDRAVESTKKERWHNYYPVKGGNVIRYSYERKFPHVGIGKHVSM